MGKIFRRPDRGDTWYADYYDRNGKRCKPSLQTSDAKVAREKLRDLELATTDRVPHKTETIDAALEYFVDVAHANSPKGTISCYRQKARHVSGILGATDCDALTREAVERYIAARLKDHAHPHSVHKELVVLRGALKSAKDHHRFHGSLDVVPKFAAHYEPRRVFQTPEQFIAMIEQLAPLRPNSKPGPLARQEARRCNRTLWCMLIALASPRYGEVEALQWEHVDFARNRIQIPKGKTLSRPIALDPQLRIWLEAMRQPSGPVVGPWHMIRRDLPNACRRAGVPRVTPNDLRRTFASWLVQAGVSNLIVSRLLGHSSTRMVDLVYGQLDEATLSRAIANLPGSIPGDKAAALRPPVPTRTAQNRGDAEGTNRGQKRGTEGTPGKTVPRRRSANSVEESANSRSLKVPKAGIEPAARGFSVLGDMAPKRVVSQPILKLVG
jgi:integrase